MSTEVVPVVVLGEAEAIEETRVMVTQARERIRDQAWQQAWTNTSKQGSAASLGMLTQALDAAADALFDALNVAASHCDCDASTRVLAESLNGSFGPDA